MNSEISALQRFGDIRLVRYLLASGGALAVDLGAFLALLSLGMLAVAASAIGYAGGILAHWLMSSRAVFADGLSPAGRMRRRQKALFVGSALLGLGLTTAIVGTGELAGIDPRLAKLFAMAASFIVTYLLRSRVIFRPAPTS